MNLFLKKKVYYNEIVNVCRAIKKTVPGFPRPLLNLSAEAFATVVNDAFGKPLSPAFDPYANDINYLIASYLVPYVGLTGYVGANAKLTTQTAKRVRIYVFGLHVHPAGP